MSEWCTPWKSWISCFNLLNGLNLQPPATQITNGKIRRLQTRKIASSRNRKQPNQKKLPKKKWHCRLCYGCLWVLRLASLMTADLDAQPRLTKHFDSPFVVRLRLCFSPFLLLSFYCSSLCERSLVFAIYRLLLSLSVLLPRDDTAVNICSFRARWIPCVSSLRRLPLFLSMVILVYWFYLSSSALRMKIYAHLSPMVQSIRPDPYGYCFNINVDKRSLVTDLL